jgi:hypothetical protein
MEAADSSETLVKLYLTIKWYFRRRYSETSLIWINWERSSGSSNNPD